MVTTASGRTLRCLLVGVRSHGGEEVYSTLLRDRPPPGVSCVASMGFHSSCEGGRSGWLTEIALNRVVHPRLPFNMGFRVLHVGPSVDLVHVHTHPTVLRGLGKRPVVFSASSSHYHYARDYEGRSAEWIAARYAAARRVYGRLRANDGLLNAGRITLMYTFSRFARGAYLDQGIPDWKIRVLYPGFDVPPPPEKPAGRPVTFLFMARHFPRKGGDLALEAFGRLRERRPDARLVYVSDSRPERDFPAVEFLPLVPADRVGMLYSRADVFLSPTRAEGFGFTNVEAQGWRLPVISTRLGAIPEVVEDGRTGFLTAPDDAEGLLAVMDRLAGNRDLREDMAAAARRRFVERFSLEVFHAGLREIYHEAAERARSSNPDPHVQ
jgi:glycosyltransferase involved in cell wall biosynthesis